MSNKRSLALLGASSMLLSILPAAAFAQAPAAKTLEHLKLSHDKVKDPVEISALWASKVGKAENVLVTTDAVFADSLASGALQGTQKAPLLFIDPKAGLDEQTVKTITSLGAKKVTILGGEQAISKTIAEALGKVAGVTSVERVSGETRVETSVALAEKTTAKNDTVIIARSDDYADSLAAGALAARTGFPVVLVPQPYKVTTGTDKDKKETEVVLHPAVEAYLKKANIKKTIVAGGPSAVNDKTFNAIKAIVSDTTRAAGESRRETAVALAKLWQSTGKVTVVEGYSDVNGFHNGFAAALSAANLGAPVILSNKTEALKADELGLAGPNAQAVTGYCGTYVNDAICKAVADKQGAAVKTVKLAESQAVLPLKVTPSDLASLVGASKDAPNRQYEVTETKPDVEYTIKLAKGKKDEKGNIVLDLGTDSKPKDSDAASIAVVNGSKATGENNVRVKAVAGKISFSVEANKENGSGYVIPIITALDGEQIKTVGQGGPLLISPQAAENGKYLGDNNNKTNDWTVESVDKASKTITLVSDDNTTKRTIVYKEIDLIHKDNTNAGSRVAFAEFVKEISKGDKFKASKDAQGTLYYSAPTLASTLVWVNAAPVKPTVVASTNKAATEDAITLKLGGIIAGAKVTVKAAKVGTNPAQSVDYKGSEDKFTITRVFESAKVTAGGEFEATITGLDPNSKYDFAVSQQVGEETSAFGDYGAAGGTDNPAHVLETTLKPAAVGIASVDRKSDIVNDGAGVEEYFKVTLNTDQFDGATIDPTKIKIVASTGGVVETNTAGAQDVATGNAVGKAETPGKSKEFWIRTKVILNDASNANDIEYTLKLDQGALKAAAPAGALKLVQNTPNTPAEFKFKYR